MEETVIEAKGELSGEMKPAPKKKRNPFVIVFNVFLVAVIACGLALSVFLLVLRVTYSGTCYINGTSMYPTLNAEGRSYSDENSNGKYFYEQGGKLVFLPSHDGDLVDYGYVDGKEGALNSLKRFDIVVTYYQNDYDPSTGKVIGAPKVKRIIGLPGETLTLVPDYSPMGKLTINDEVVEQPGNSFEHYNAPLQEAGLNISYPASNDLSNHAPWQYLPITLGEDEYYVCGDNRFGDWSADSRSRGPVRKKDIQAVVKTMIGLCRIGDDDCKLDWSTLKMPWDWKSL